MSAGHNRGHGMRELAPATYMSWKSQSRRMIKVGADRVTINASDAAGTHRESSLTLGGTAFGVVRRGSECREGCCGHPLVLVL